VTVGFSEVYAPQGQQLYAQFYLNYESQGTIAGILGTQLKFGTDVDYSLTQRIDNPNIYTLVGQGVEPEFEVMTYGSSALVTSSSAGVNTISGFISDQFPPAGEGPNQQPGSDHYTTTPWVWQIVPSTECAQVLESLLQ
jgi:hypothetical protein